MAAMSRWDPFQDLMSIQNELNRFVVAIEIPKAEEARPKKITVKATG